MISTIPIDAIDDICMAVLQFDVPAQYSNTERIECIDSLISYYESIEQYEKCAELLRKKQSQRTSPRFCEVHSHSFNFRVIQILGYRLPDSILKTLKR